MGDYEYNAFLFMGIDNDNLNDLFSIEINTACPRNKIPNLSDISLLKPILTIIPLMISIQVKKSFDQLLVNPHFLLYTF